jgi:hypothetical protein
MHYASTRLERCVAARRIPSEGASKGRAWEMRTMRARFKMKSLARSKTGAAIRIAAGRGTRILALAVPMLLLAMPAWSGGIGGSFTYGVSDGEVDDTDDFFPNIQTSAKHYEVGVSYDTNLAADRLINYRINANFQFVEQKLNQGSIKVDIDGTGFSVNQLLGFGLVRTPMFRLFMGPTIHLGFAGFDDDDKVAGVKVNYEELLFTAGIGPELGINYHVGRNLTVSVSGHYRYGFQLQGFDNPLGNSNNSDGVFVGHEHRVGVTMAVYFRFSGDQYKAASK